MTWRVSGIVELAALGDGASGRVVLGRHEATGTRVAVKYLAADLVEPQFLAAFRGEARILSEIEDEHVVRLFEYVQQGRAAAIVMEYIEGASLAAILRDQPGPLSPQASLCTLKGSLLGLASVHARGVVHRDVKPDNIIVDVSGQTRLIDFGIATRVGRDGVVAGTPSYLAPELWRGEPASAAADVYAATATFAECVSGRRRFTGESLEAIRLQHERRAPELADVPEAVRPLIQRGLAKRVPDRPASAAQFVDELEALAASRYGPYWERRGRDELRALALLLMDLLPTPIAVGAGAGESALTWLGSAVVGAVAAGAIVIAGQAAASPGVSHAGNPTQATASTSLQPSTPSTPSALPDPRPSATEAPTPSRSATPTTPPRPTPLPPPPISTAASSAPPPPAPVVPTLGKLSLTPTGSAGKFYVTLDVTSTGSGPFVVVISYSDGTTDAFPKTSPASGVFIQTTHVFVPCSGIVKASATANPAASNGIVATQASC